MMKRTVQTAVPYEIRIGSRLLETAGETLAPLLAGKKLMLVADETVYSLYGKTLRNSLACFGFSVSLFLIQGGETAKTTDVYLRLLNALAEAKLTRTDAVLAFGGGTVGDLAGFTAATYLRGIDFVQIPTTLLAMTDSSVGGKTGINLAAGKNLAGAFHQPRLVLADTDTLNTLPKKERGNGAGEIIKCAVLAGGALWDAVVNGAALSAPAVIAACADYKCRIVEEDEKEHGMRRLLNLGHTLGHAAEKRSGYTLSHGACVGVGILLMAEAACRAGTLSKENCASIRNALSAAEIPLTFPYPTAVLLEEIVHDKKTEGDILHAVVINGIGNCAVKPMTIASFQEYLL